MSLYTPESLIRKIIMEADDFTLTPSPDAQEFVGGSTPEEIAARTPPPAGAGGAMGGQTMTLPQVTQQSSTSQKTVFNNGVILAQLAELKAVITGTEKQFDPKTTLTPEAANIYISKLLDTLVKNAKDLNKLLSEGGLSEGGSSEEQLAVEEPSNVTAFQPSSTSAAPEEAMPLAAGRSYINEPTKG